MVSYEHLFMVGLPIKNVKVLKNGEIGVTVKKDFLLIFLNKF